MGFTFTAARELLPAVQEITAEAARQTEVLAGTMDDLADDDPQRTQLDLERQMVVDDWTERIRGLGLQAKGLWLVDFDNGEGYYCWQHPEPSLTHYHGYDEGFAGRMKIV